MPVLTYHALRSLGRFCAFQTLVLKTLRPHLLSTPGPFILACSHLSHLEPFLVSITMPRKIDWIARIEMFPPGPGAWFMRSCDSIPIRRFGVPTSTFHSALTRLKEGRVIGIFPEGGVAQGKSSILRGGEFKLGATLLSQRAQLPILPCAVLGTPELNAVKPWLPFRRAHLWIAFAPFLPPPPTSPHRQTRRAHRQHQATQLSTAYQSLYNEMLTTWNLNDSMTP